MSQKPPVNQLISDLRAAVKSQPQSVQEEVVLTIDAVIENGIDRTCPKFDLLHTAMSTGNMRAMAFLVQAGIDINSCDQWGRTVLMHVCSANMPDMARKILDLGASVHCANGMGWTALFMATYRGHTDCMQPLIDRGADVNHVSSEGRTLLMWAAMVQDPACVNKLLQAGAEINARDPLGRSALFHACMQGAVHSASALLEHGADVSGVDQQALNQAGDPHPDSEKCLTLIAAHGARRAAHEALSSLSLSHAGATP